MLLAAQSDGLVQIQIERAGDIEKTCKANRAIACGFLALNLLMFESQPLREVGLRVTTSDTSFDEEVGQFAERVQFQYRYLLRFQRLVFCHLLAQVSQLRLDALAHGKMKTCW